MGTYSTFFSDKADLGTWGLFLWDSGLPETCA